jgi:hypothetical protein
MRKEKLGPYLYDPDFDESIFGTRVSRETTAIWNGAKYTGEWREGTEIKQGRGT